MPVLKSMAAFDALFMLLVVVGHLAILEKTLIVPAQETFHADTRPASPQPDRCIKA